MHFHHPEPPKFALFDRFRNSRAARHLPCASRKQPTRCDITPLKKVRSIVDPTTRFRRLYKNISDPGDSKFLGRRNRNQNGHPREEACTELRPEPHKCVQNYISGHVSSLLCNALLTISKVQFFKSIGKWTSKITVAAETIEQTFFDAFLTALRCHR